MNHLRLPPVIVAAGCASLALYLIVALAGSLRERLTLYLVIHGLLFALYAAVVSLVTRLPAILENGRPAGSPAARTSTERSAAARALNTGTVIAIFAVAFRAALLFTPASLSDDIHRYVWDGRVQTRGINPYAHAPASHELSPLRDTHWNRINHREITTVYAPLSEAVFLTSAAAGLDETGFKAVFCALDLAVALALAYLLRRLGKSPHLAVIYAWNPLVVVEVASSGHADSLGVLFLVLATGLIIGEQRTLSTSCYALSVLARLLPLTFVPIFARRLQSRYLLLGTAIVCLGVAPYSGAREELFSGLRVYVESWDFNSVSFPILRSMLEATVPVEALKRLVTDFKDAIGDPAWCQILYRYVWPAPLARALLLIALVTGVLVISFKVTAIHRELYLSSGLLLVLSPTLHPWYLLWILPFAALEASWTWIVFSGLAPLSYLSLRSGDGRTPVWVLVLEWGAPAAIALLLYLRRSRFRLSSRSEEAGAAP